MNSTLVAIAKIERNLDALGHFADTEDEMEFRTAQHMIDLLQLDMLTNLGVILDEYLESEKERATEDVAGNEARKLTDRIREALETLETAGNEVISASVAYQSTDNVSGHISRTACLIGSAKRILRGQDELVERRIPHATANA